MLAQRRLRDAEHARNVRFLSSVTELFCLIDLFGEPGRKEVSSRVAAIDLKTGQPARRATGQYWASAKNLTFGVQL